ncbi:MAG: PD-(D/E)XK nuclease domain-containing protein [Dissulfurimicrobium sp.]
MTEDNTSKGRIDLTIIVNKKIVYILEFKIIQNEKEKGKALNQIKQKEYYKKMNIKLI